MACLGATDNDFSTLGYEALSHAEFEVAARCF